MKKNNKDDKQDGRRVARVEKEVQGVISTYVIQNLQSELPGLVTISRVMIPADLRSAKVYVSLLTSIGATQAEDDEHLAKAVKTLQSWAPEIQERIDQQLKMRYLPRVTFYADESTERILKIEKILSNLKPSQEVDDDDYGSDDN